MWSGVHAQFHEEAAKVAQLASPDNAESAEKGMGAGSDYSKVSAALRTALDRWSAAV